MAGPDDPNAAVATANAAASTSLRDTAKWLVGGVAATGVGIFAGSSLTKLGSLSFADSAPRLWMAIGGLALGFIGLAIILTQAIAVLTVDSLDFPTLATEKGGSVAKTRTKLEKRYKGTLPGGATELDDLFKKADAAEDKSDDDSVAFMAEFLPFIPALMAEAGFLNVRFKFGFLVVALYIGSPLALLGFGLFAWAANPPDVKPPPAKPPLLVINAP